MEELKLSRGEERVLLASLEGKLDKEVAAELGISVYTVRSFWRRIRTKLGGVTRSEVLTRVTRLALERELGVKQTENERLLTEMARRREAEQEASRRARLLDLAHDAIIVWELGGGVQYWNRGAEELYGYTAFEVMGRAPDDFLRTEYPVSVQDAESALVRRGTWSGMLHHTTKEGHRVVVESRYSLVREEGMSLSVMETNRDVTGRIEAERHLQMYQSVFENAQVGMAVDDGQRLTYVNKEFAWMHGYEPRELEGLPLQFLFTKEERRRSQELDEKIADRGSVTLVQEHVKKNGETIRVLKQISATKDDQGKVVHRSITLLEAALIKTWDELLEADSGEVRQLGQREESR